MESVPTLDDLRCLIGWPAFTRGFVSELEMLTKYLAMCNEHGFGRMCQIAEAVKDIWRHPEKLPAYRKDQQKRLDFLMECRKEVEKPVQKLSKFSKTVRETIKDLSRVQDVSQSLKKFDKLQKKKKG